MRGGGRHMRALERQPDGSFKQVCVDVPEMGRPGARDERPAGNVGSRSRSCWRGRVAARRRGAVHVRRQQPRRAGNRLQRHRTRRRLSAATRARPSARSGSRRSSEAANIWAAALDSRVPIVIDARFAPLACTRDRDRRSGRRARPGWWRTAPACRPTCTFPRRWPIASPRWILIPGEADIEATSTATCSGAAASARRLVLRVRRQAAARRHRSRSSVVHARARPRSRILERRRRRHRRAARVGIDRYVQRAHLRQRHRPRLDGDEQRAACGLGDATSRHLVWNGENVTRVAPLVLGKGAPRLRVTPMPIGFQRRARRGELRSSCSRPAGAVTGAVARRHPDRRLRAGPQLHRRRSCCSRAGVLPVGAEGGARRNRRCRRRVDHRSGGNRTALLGRRPARSGGDVSRARAGPRHHHRRCQLADSGGSAASR